MLFGCCTTIDNYALLEKHGYDRIILSAVDLMAMDAARLEQTIKTLNEGSVKCRALNSFCPPSLRLCGDGYIPDSVEKYAARLAARANRIGAEYIGVGAPKSRSISEGFLNQKALSQFRQSMGILCAACAPYNINVLLEAVCSLECNFITTTDEALDIVKTLQKENLALVFDTYHAFMMDEDDVPLRRALGSVKLVHVAQDIGNERHYLRRDNIPEYRIYFDALLDGGFDGEVSVEAFFDDIGAQLGETLQIMKQLCSGKGN